LLGLPDILIHVLQIFRIRSESLLDEGLKTQMKQQSTTVDSTTVEEQRIPAAITDAGCERELNEDRYAVIEGQAGLAWFVCDGMGGSEGGELAAQLAIDGMRRVLEGAISSSVPPEQALRMAIAEANRVIVLRRQNPAFASMGTTVVGVIIEGAEVGIGSVGDSRAYLYRRGEIEQITSDHTYVQALVERGQITQQEALTHPDAHVLTRCVGATSNIEIDIKKFWLNPTSKEPDLLVLCSDGLYSHVTDLEIAQAIHSHSPRGACTALVDIAKSRGGLDNITIAIIPLDGKLLDAPPQGYVAPVHEMQEDDEVAEALSKRKDNSPISLVQLVAMSMLMAGIGSVAGIGWLFINLN
jgi:serine/threonine protein phosphatase PrpC